MAAGNAVLNIKILADATQAQRGLDATASKAGRMGAGIRKAAAPAALALAGIGAAAISMGQAAAEDAQSQAILATALKNTTGATSSQVAAVEDHISAMSAATGVADDQLRPAMGNLVRATGDVTKSQDAMGVAMDVAAATGKDVESVSKAMAKAYGGNTASLGKLVPGMDATVLASKDMTAIMGELSRVTGGSAAAAADTAAGKMQRMKTAMAEAQESIGAALLPVMSKLGDVLGKVAVLIQKHSTLFVVIVGVVAAFAAAILVANAAMTVYTVVTTIAASATAAAWLAALWPILLVIAAVLAVVAVIVLLWNKFPPFKAAVLAVWGAIRTATGVVVSFIKSAWAKIWPPLQAALRLFGTLFKVQFAAIKLVVRLVAAVLGAVFRVAFGIIRAVAAPVIALIKVGFNAIKPVILAIANAMKGPLASAFRVLKTVASAVGSVISSAFNGLRSIIDAITGAVNSLIHALDNIHVPDIHLPSFLGGGKAAPAMVAPVGVGAQSLVAPARSSRRSSAGGLTIVIQGAIDPESTARQVRRLLASHDRRMGLTGAGLRTGLV